MSSPDAAAFLPTIERMATEHAPVTQHQTPGRAATAAMTLEGHDAGVVALEPVFAVAAGIGAGPMTMPSDAPAFEVRTTLADGSRVTFGRFTTASAANDQAQMLLSQPDVRRVETLRRHGGRVELIGVIGWPAPAPRRRADGDR